MNFGGLLFRFIVSFLVINIIGSLHWGMRVAGYRGAFAAAFIITLLTFVVERIAGAGISSVSRRRWMGYITAFVVVYLTQFFMPQLFSVSLVGTLIAALFIGLADTFIPSFLR